MIARAWRRLLCKVIGHDWWTDLDLFASDLRCELVCHRCGERVAVTEPWRKWQKRP